MAKTEDSRLLGLIKATGMSRRELAELMGYSSHNSLFQHINGRTTMPDDEAAWLERFARLRTRFAAAQAAWLIKNPAPNRK
jgi:hypothetical protein